MYSEIRGVVMCSAVFFAAFSHANNELPKPAPTAAVQSLNPIAGNSANNPQPPAPDVTGAAPKSPTPAPNETEPDNIDNPIVDGAIADGPIADSPITNSPIASRPDGALTELPTSKRLAISILAGVFTLIVALWIGARRD